jgi:hypothetical protein
MDTLAGMAMGIRMLSYSHITKRLIKKKGACIPVRSYNNGLCRYNAEFVPALCKLPTFSVLCC